MKKLFAILLVILIIGSLTCTYVSAETVSYSIGDVDMDGTIEPNSHDLVAMIHILLGIDDISNLEMADVNLDENINLLDLVHLKKIIANTQSIVISKSEGNVITDNWE